LNLCILKNMRKAVLFFFLFVLAIFSFPKPSFAVSRYATCDSCGLCPTITNGSSSNCTVDTVPGDWKKCAQCLYPAKYPAGSVPDPTNCDTLLIDDTTNLAKYPATAGRQYTMFGCITTGAGVGFSSDKGAPSFVQAMLNVVFSLTGGVALLYLLYGAFIVLTSQADPERLNYGKRLIYGSIVGLLLTFGSVFIVNLIGSGILHIPGISTSSTP